MKHYIDTNSKTYGFEEDQADLIPTDCIEIPALISFDKYPFLSIVDGSVYYDQAKHEAKISEIEARLQAEADAKVSALNKLSALGLTEDEIKALMGKK